MNNRNPLSPGTRIKRHVNRMFWLLLGVSMVIAAIGYVETQAMNAVRGYVRGESLWAKAQRDATNTLHDYLHAPDAVTFRAFEQHLQVNLDYRKARLEMLKLAPDIDLARASMIAAGSHPDDVTVQYWLFVLMRDVNPMKGIIAFWTEGDRYIEALHKLAADIRAHHLAHPQDSLQVFRPQLDQVGRQLTTQENAFSAGLGEGARWVSSLILLSNLAIMLLTFLLAWIFARKAVRDIDRTESELRDSESRFRALNDTHLIGIVIWDFHGHVYDANDAFLDIVGYSRDDLLQGHINWQAMTPMNYAILDEIALHQIAERGYCDPFLKAYWRKSGEQVAVLVGGAMIDGQIDRCISFVLDRRKEKHMEDELRLAATVLESSLDGILIADQNRNVLTVNDAYCRLTGFSRNAVLDSMAEFGPADNDDVRADIESGLQANGYWQGDTFITLANGRSLPVRASLSSVRDEFGNVLHYVAVFTDISVRQAMERELKNLAHFDHLTGLANRSLFADRLDTALLRAHRSQRVCALLFIDLDRFKQVNDQHGHAVGDLLLQQVAQRLKSAVRESDTVGRLGGDEFVAIIEGVDSDDSAVQIADKMIAQLQEPFVVAGHPVSLGCSIGIGLYPRHGESAQALMRAADDAMYAAKAAPDRHYAVHGELN